MRWDLLAASASRCQGSLGSTTIANTMRRASLSEFHRKCAVLVVETLITAAELLKVYRLLINKWHPDRHRSDASAHERATQ
jgi:hypothetical protein